MIKAVIFDRDGVLSYYDFQAMNTFFKALLPFNIEQLILYWNQYGAYVGWPRSLDEERLFFTAFWQQLGADHNLPPETVQILQRWSYLDVMGVFTDVLPCLQWIRQQHWQIGVLSNVSLASLNLSLEDFGLLEYVDLACTATTIGVSKPDPQAFLITAQQLGVEPTACVLIDDTPGHVASALSVGMQAYLLDRTEQHQQLDLPRIQSLHELAHVIVR